MHPIMAHLLPSVPRQVHRLRYRTRNRSFSIASLFRLLLSRFVSPLFYSRQNFRFLSFILYYIQILSRPCRYNTTLSCIYSFLNNKIEIMTNLDEIYNHTYNWPLINISHLLVWVFVILIFAFFVFFNYFLHLFINYKVTINEFKSFVIRTSSILFPETLSDKSL